MTKAKSDRAHDSAPKDRICVLVLGMHRSGTSALTRVLNMLGCDLPKNIVPAHTSNEAGHWEPSSVVQLNDEILESAGSHLDDWVAFNSAWYSSPKKGDFVERALGVLDEEFRKSSLFVLKDPRICRITPFWLDVLATAGIRPAVVIPIRNPLEVAESLHVRNGFDQAFGHLLWLRHVLDAEAATRNLDRFYCSYDNLLDSWPYVVSKSQESLRINWPRLSPIVSDEISSFLTDNLRHHRKSNKNVIANPLLSSWVRDAFSIFERWIEHDEVETDYAELDQIRSDFDAATPAFAQLVSAGQNWMLQAKMHYASFKETEAKVSEIEATSTAQQEHYAQLQTEVETLVAAKVAVEGQLGELKDALEASTALAGERERTVAEVTERLSGVQAELTARQEEVETLVAAKAAVEGQLSYTQSALAQRSAEADEVTARLQSVQAELSALERMQILDTDRINSLIYELKTERTRLSNSFEETAMLTKLIREREMDIVNKLETMHLEQARVHELLDEALNARKQETRRADVLEEELELERSQYKHLLNENNSLKERFHETEKEINNLRDVMDIAEKEASAELEIIQSEKRVVEERLGERFDEIVVMSRLLGDRERAISQADDRVVRLRQVSLAMIKLSSSGTLKDWFFSLLPLRVRLAKQKIALKKSGVFDSEAYLATYPDVAESGMDPLWHYINHGVMEGRRPY